MRKRVKKNLAKKAFNIDGSDTNLVEKQALIDLAASGTITVKKIAEISKVTYSSLSKIISSGNTLTDDIKIKIYEAIKNYPKTVEKEIEKFTSKY